MNCFFLLKINAMLTFRKINSDNDFSVVARNQFVDFLYIQLGEYGDAPEAIQKCIDYAFSNDSGKGGFCMIAFDQGAIVGGLIMNFTGMNDFIPPNILVYVAVDINQRGKGLGRQLIDHSIKECNGDVALHVEYENPAKMLYERLGFTSKYAEMRINRLG